MLREPSSTMYTRKHGKVGQNQDPFPEVMSGGNPCHKQYGGLPNVPGIHADKGTNRGKL